MGDRGWAIGSTDGREATPQKHIRESAPSNERRDGRREGAGIHRERGRGAGETAPGRGDDWGRQPPWHRACESLELCGGDLRKGSTALPYL